MPIRPATVSHALISLCLLAFLGTQSTGDLAHARSSGEAVSAKDGRHKANKAETSQPRAQGRAAPSAGRVAVTTVDRAVESVHSGLPPSVVSSLKRARIPLNATSFYVIRLGAKVPVVTWNAQTPMNPASTMKLVTTFAGLQLLGPNFRWQTSLYAEREPDHDGVVGNVYLRGHGDPKLVPEEMAKLVAQALRSGTTTIGGDIVLDRSYFADGLADGGTIDGEVQRAYNVNPDALLYSFKTLSFKLIPDRGSGTVNVLTTPELAQLRVDNRLSLSNGKCGDWRSAAMPSINPQPDGTVLASFKGSYAEDCGEQTLNLAALSHSEFIAGGFLAAWHAAGGKVSKTPAILTGRVPRPAFLLVRHYGPSLADIVRDINKYSNNVMARQLYLTIGAEMDRKGPASTVKSAQVIRRWLARQGLDMPGLTLDNGSGLSRDERISAYDLASLLQQAAASDVGPILFDSLPILGVDGTLRLRLTQSPAANHGRLKTGTLADVRAIAGYIDAQNGERYVVVALVNHPNAAQAQAAHDALLEWVYLRELVER